MKYFAMLCAIALFAVGCTTVSAVAPTDTSKTVTPNNGVNESAPVSAAGVWDANLQCHGHIEKLIVRLKQSGNMVEGAIDIDTRGHGRDYNNVPVRGKLKGNKLSLKIPAFAYGYIEATVVGNRLEDGYYRGHSDASFSADLVKN